MLRLYDFKCSSCEAVFEELARTDEKEVACTHCGAVANRLITPVRFDCGGGLDPDFPTAYAQWGEKRRLSRAKKWGRLDKDELARQELD